MRLRVKDQSMIINVRYHDCKRPIFSATGSKPRDLNGQIFRTHFEEERSTTERVMMTRRMKTNKKWYKCSPYASGVSPHGSRDVTTGQAVSRCLKITQGGVRQSQAEAQDKSHDETRQKPQSLVEARVNMALEPPKRVSITKEAQDELA